MKKILWILGLSLGLFSFGYSQPNGNFNVVRFPTANDTTGYNNGTLIKSNFDGNLWFKNGAWVSLGGGLPFASVITYGAIANDIEYNDGIGSASAATFTSALATFSSADIGKAIKIAGAGTAGAELLTTILSYTDPHTVELSTNIITSVTNAKFDYGTDNCTAFENTINYIGSVGGGVVYIPRGKYAFSCDFVTNDINGNNPNSQIYIPAPTAVGSVINGYSIVIMGETNYYTPTQNNPNNGAVLHTYRNQGTGTRPSFFGGRGYSSSQIPYENYCNISLVNITLLQSSNGGVTPTNMITANCLDFGTVTTDKFLVQYEDSIYSASMTNPLGTGGAGFIVSKRDNNGSNTIKNTWVGGAYEYGLVLGEHTYLDGVNVSGAYNALTILNGNFNVGGTIVTNFAVNHILFPNTTLFGESAGTGFVNLLWEFETSGLATPPSWLTFTAFIVDAGQYGRGTIQYNYQNGQDFGDLVQRPLYGLNCFPYSRQTTTQLSTGANYVLSTLAGVSNKAIFEVSALPATVADASDNYAQLQLVSNQHSLSAPVGYFEVLNRYVSPGLENRYYINAITTDASIINTSHSYEYLISAGILTQISEASPTQKTINTNTKIEGDLQLNNSTNSLLIGATSSYYNRQKLTTVATANNTPTTLLTIAVPRGTIITGTINVSWRKDLDASTSGSAFCEFAASNKEDGSVQTANNTTIRTAGSTSATLSSISFTGENLLVKVTGIAATDINWVGTFSYSINQ